MKARTYRPEPHSLIADALLLIHQAGELGLTSSALARGIDRESNVLHGLIRQSIEADVVVVRNIVAPNAIGHRRRLRRYVGTPKLQECVEHIHRARLESTRPADPLPSTHPALDQWLRSAAATTPRTPYRRAPLMLAHSV